MLQAKLAVVLAVLMAGLVASAARWRVLWSVLWPTRAVALVLAAGALVLLATDQGGELAEGVADAGLWASACFLAATTGLGMCALVDRSSRALFLRERAGALPPARLLPSPRHR